MSKGVLLFAHNNSTVDYVKQADFCAAQIKKHLNLPVCLITSDKFNEDKNNFNHVIVVPKESTSQKNHIMMAIRDIKIYGVIILDILLIH